MKKYKTSELTGLLLDEAVVKALGFDYKVYISELCSQVYLLERGYAVALFRPSLLWCDCGPLIGKFKIDHITWLDTICEVSTVDEVYSWGKDELEAICRVAVKTKFGEEVEL